MKSPEAFIQLHPIRRSLPVDPYFRIGYSINALRFKHNTFGYTVHHWDFIEKNPDIELEYVVFYLPQVEQEGYLPGLDVACGFNILLRDHLAGFVAVNLHSVFAQKMQSIDRTLFILQLNFGLNLRLFKPVLPYSL